VLKYNSEFRNTSIILRFNENDLENYAIPISLTLGLFVLIGDFLTSPSIPFYILYLIPLVLYLRYERGQGVFSALITCILVVVGIVNVRVGWELDLLGRIIFMGLAWMIFYVLRMYTDQSDEISDLRRRLDEKEHQLEHFAYVASHDLNEPLRSLTSFTEILNEEHKDEFQDETATYFRFISEASAKMRGLIDGLLQYSRLGRNRNRKIIDLELLFQKLSKKHDIKIITEDLPKVQGMEKETEILFTQLLDNAYKFRSPDKPLRILIDVEEVNDEWNFVVKDNGIGIPVKNTAKLFDLFTKLHGPSKYKGRGLGLALSHRIVELHGGMISAEPNQGGGTIIKFNYKKK